MAQQIINVGLVANDNTGDTLRAAFVKTNDNFTEIYSGNPTFTGSPIFSPTGNGSVVITNSGTSEALRITQNGTGDALRVEDAANPDATPFRITGDGLVLVGGPPVIGGATTYPVLQVTGYGDGTIGANAAAMGINGFLPSGAGTYFAFNRSNSATVGTNATVANGDQIGRIVWSGADGTNYIRAAQISVDVDGAPGTNSMPGRLIFATTASGATSATERMRITSEGIVGIGAIPLSGTRLNIGGTYLSSAGYSNGITLSGVVPVATTISHSNYASLLYIQDPGAAGNTIPGVIHFETSQPNNFVNTVVTNQTGFRAGANLTGATNNFGFSSNIPDGVTRTITTVARVTNVVTITTSVAHGYVAGQSVTVTATTNTSLNGTFVIATTPTTTTFTYSQTGTDIVSVADTGSTKVVGRWNFYAVGTADNFFAGRIGIGTTSPGESLDVRGNLRVGGADAGPNYIAFRGTTGDAPGSYITTYIGERIYASTENSELVLFKGNDQSGGSGPDRIRLAAANIVFDTYVSPVSGTFEQAATSANLITRAIITDVGNFGIGITAPSRLLHLQQTNAATNTVTRLLRLDNYSTGTPANGIGTGIEFAVETTDNNLEIGAAIDAVVTDVTATSEDFDLVFRTMNAGAAVTEKVRIDSVGNVGIGDSSPFTRGRLSVLATTGVGRQFVVTSAGLTQARYDDNSLPSIITLQNHGMTGANQGAAIQWTLGNSDANSQNAAAIRVTAEGTWDATTASRDSAMAFFTTLDGNMSERVRIDSAGNTGFGGTASAGRTVELLKNVTGSTTGINLRIAGVAQSDVTSSYRGVSTALSTSAGSYTVGEIVHYYTFLAGLGSGSAVTSQYGFLADSTLIGATNNFGFYSNIASGTGRWNFYANGTADNYFAGKVGIGAVPQNTSELRVSRSSTGNTNQYGILSELVAQSDVTSLLSGFTTSLNTQAASFTLTNLRHFSVGFQSIGAGSTITNQVGFYVPSILTNATNNYAFYSDVASGTGRWNFYANGSADNHFNSRILIGRTYSGNERIGIGGSTSATGESGIYNDTTVGSATTTAYTAFNSYISTAAASFTLGNLTHYKADQFTIGANSAITNQYGFFAANLTGGTNNFGFHSNVASGTNRWNFYAAGTATNYFSGSVFVGNTNSGGTEKLFVEQSADAHTARFVNSTTTAAIRGIQVHSTSNNIPGLTLSRWSSSFAGNADIGQIRFDGLGTSATYVEHASIYATATGANTATGAPTKLSFRTSDGTASAERMSISATGVVAMTANITSTSTTTGSLVVTGGVGISGALNATTKSFIIDHPTKPGKLLKHGSLEGPEFGVYVRGKLKGTNVIELPEYWTKLVDPDTITVNITPIGRHQDLYVEDIVDNRVIIRNGNLVNKEIHCFYTVFAERADVEKLEVETI